MNRRLQHIDGLRGIAALLVVCAHWIGMIADHTVPHWAKTSVRLANAEFFSFGRFGVVAFFCVSGFVIPFSFKGARPLTAFIISRIFRLYPVYWLVCAVTIISVPGVAGSISRFGLFANITMLTKFLGQPYVLGVAWTLTVELVFYVICFCSFGMKILHSAKFNLFVMIALLAVAAAMSMFRWVNPGSHLPAQFPTFLAAMHYGTLVRLWLVELNITAKRLASYATILLGCAVIAVNYLGYWHTNETEIGVVAITSGYVAGVGLFIWCAVYGRFAGDRLASLGAVSYSLYLIHPFVLAVTAPLWPYLGPWWAAAATLTVINLGGSILLSHATFRLVEVPAQKIGRKITVRWTQLAPIARTALANDIQTGLNKLAG